MVETWDAKSRPRQCDWYAGGVAGALYAEPFDETARELTAEATIETEET
jgi:hypothetical protein